MLVRLGHTLIVGLTLATLSVASSQRPPPLAARALSHPQELAVSIIPRRADATVAKRAYSDPNQPAWDDRFLLTFSAHDGPVVLSLRPSDTLVHPDGIRLHHTHTADDGLRTTSTSYIAREHVRAYEGWVLDPDEDNLERWVREETAGVRRDDSARGNVRIVLSEPDADDDEGVRFQGTFTARGELFTVHSTESYRRKMEPLDPEPPLLLKRTLAGSTYAYPSMVIVRESDTLSPHEQLATLRKRGLPIPGALEADAVTAVSCGHDHLSFNSDPAHPVHEAALEQAVFDALAPSTPWLLDVFGMPARHPASATYGAPRTVGYAYPPKTRAKRQGGDISGGTNASGNFIGSIGNTAGCPKAARVLFMGVALDCTYVAHYGSADLARTQVLTDFNSASALYLTSFNISLGIVELNVQSGPCPTTAAQVDASNPWNVGCQEGGGPGIDLNERLSTFSAWRGAKGGADGAGLWHLLTNCSSGSEVGVAWLGQLCRVTSQGSGAGGQTSSGTGVTAITRSEWQVVAHEIGHNFGAIHDCATGCSLSNSNPVCCPLSTTTCDSSANFIMSPVSQKVVSTFSPCSIGNVCSALSSSLNVSCLATPGAASNPPLISLKSCGNGILEAGEDCDPGSNMNDPCCNAATCKFAAGAVCDPSSSLCCTSSCQIASAGTVCRPSIDDRCDKVESCGGNSADCPVDEFVSDGTSCGADSLACATGVCTSRALQCRTAGASLNLSAACPARASDTCSISCQDPSSSRDCIVLQESFRSGTPCGYAGTCENGSCQAGSGIEVAKSWYRQNLQISIPVTIVVAIIVLLFLAAIWRCCSRRRNQSAAARMPPSARFAAGGIPPPPRRSGGNMMQQQQRAPQQGGMRGSNDNSSSSLASQPFFPPPSGPPPPMRPAPGYVPSSTSRQSRTLRRGEQPRQGNYAQGPPMSGAPGGWVDPGAWNGPSYRG